MCGWRSFVANQSILKNLRSFCRKLADVAIYAFFCVKFLLPKLRSRKLFDKYHVCSLTYNLKARDASASKNRVFIACKKERSKVIQLVSGGIEMKDFISAEMTSRNGALLQELVEYLADSFVNLPEEYSNFLKNISKAYAVSSLIQVQTWYLSLLI